jgi:uncharacterized protein (TIGR02611 family)
MMTPPEHATQPAPEMRNQPDVPPVVEIAQRTYARRVLRHARRLIVAVIGSTVVLIGVALIVLPGPAILVIPLGIAILATEFVWAKRLLDRARAEAGRAGRAVRARWPRQRREPTP